jgi:signal transduction histidine kinase
VARNAVLSRAGPAAVLALALLLGALSAGYTWIMVRHLRDDARETGRLLGRVFVGLNDPRADAAANALLDLATQVRALGVPLAVTDADGRITATDNVPPGLAERGDSTALRAWIAELDAADEPIVQPGVGTIHYGVLPQARRLIWLAGLQAIVFLCLAALGVWAYRAQVAAARDRLWVAVARESAHQLGTPLMSLTGWIDYLRENPDTPGRDLITHLAADAERLERVAKRFERIGRQARQERVALGAVAERAVAYFRPRLPTLASPVTLELVASGAGPTVLGDPVLVEWALEAIIKNAIDALSGRGGRIDVRVEGAGRTASVSVRDDGPGVSPEIRSRLFEPGVSTKPGGWGLGLALARRIVEQQHGGRVAYRSGAVGGGSEFVLEFPMAATA